MLSCYNCTELCNLGHSMWLLQGVDGKHWIKKNNCVMLCNNKNHFLEFNLFIGSQYADACGQSAMPVSG